MSDYGIPFINMYGIYNEMGLPQDYYYATDHHFTLEGAFEAYTALLDNIRENTTWSLIPVKKLILNGSHFKTHSLVPLIENCSDFGTLRMQFS